MRDSFNSAVCFQWYLWFLITHRRQEPCELCGHENLIWHTEQGAGSSQGSDAWPSAGESGLLKLKLAGMSKSWWNPKLTFVKQGGLGSKLVREGLSWPLSRYKHHSALVHWDWPTRPWLIQRNRCVCHGLILVCLLKLRWMFSSNKSSMISQIATKSNDVWRVQR